MNGSFTSNKKIVSAFFAHQKPTGKAISEFTLTEKSVPIVVGISCSRDSYTLLRILFQPLAYVEESDIIELSNQKISRLSAVPAWLSGEEQKRQRRKQLIEELGREILQIRNGMISSLGKVHPRHLLDLPWSPWTKNLTDRKRDRMKETTKSKLDKELDLACQVQQLLFPPSSPICSWCCTGVKNRMVSKLGGDYFDFITMPDQSQSLFIGDVTGHGFHASVIMSLIYGYIHRSTCGDCSPYEIAQGVNSFLSTFAHRTQKLDYYFSTTLFFAIIDPNSLKMHYVNCGHTPPLAKQNGKITTLPTSGPPLGFFDTPEIEVLQFQFKPGDRLLLCTDGVIEAKNQDGEMFGTPRLIKEFQQGGGDHIEFLDELFGQLDQFTAGQENEDDMTAILLDFNRPFSSY